VARKPAWVIAKERTARGSGESIWLFGIHAVRDALANPARRCLRLVVTQNAADRLGPLVARDGLETTVADPRRFDAPLDPGSVHQGAALEALPLDWGDLDALLVSADDARPVIVALDRVTDPHNVGAILRSAEVFGARAVLAPRRHAAPETGALAKAASGALERQPYIRIGNLAAALGQLAGTGHRIIGLDGAAEADLEAAVAPGGPLVLVLGAEGPGLRPKTREACHALARIGPAGGFGSLNVSNAAAVALYVAARQGG
jgi:23S rRNA (guanosine2251-2'-O)-methyltransferase